MVLYNGFTAVALIQAVTHKVTCNNDEKGVLLTYPEIEEYVLKSNLKNIFKEIIYVYPFFAHKVSSIESCEQLVKEYYDEKFQDMGYKIEEFNEIYTACDMNHEFAIYLSLKNKKYYFYEVHPGQLCDEREKVYDWHIMNDNVHGTKEYFECQKKHKSLCANSSLVIDKICYKESLNSNHKYTSAKAFDFNGNLKQLERNIKDILLELFNAPKELYDKKNVTILLTQRQWLIPISIKETGILYQYLTDYLFSKDTNLVIKPHPSDEYNHKDFFQDVTIISNLVPAELLEIIPGLQIETAYTISSTSVTKLDHVANRIITTGNRFFYGWRYLNKLWFTYKIIKYLALEDNVYRHGIPLGDEILQFIRTECNLGVDDITTKWSDLKTNIGRSAVLVGDVTFNEYLSKQDYENYLENIDSSTVVFFLDLSLNKTFYSYKLLEHITPIIINKRQIKDKVFADITDEIVYVFCKDKEIRNKILQVSIEKIMKYTGIYLSARSMEAEELQIEQLNIRCTALEYENKQLKNKIMEIEKSIINTVNN